VVPGVFAQNQTLLNYLHSRLPVFPGSDRTRPENILARVTVEDCLEHVDNRFELVLQAAKRARKISLGAEPLVPIENDKPTVVALREIAQGLIKKEMLEDAARVVPVEETASEESPSITPTGI